MDIFWHKGTRDDFAAIRLFYDQIDPAISERLIEGIFGLTRHLARFPELGRPGRVPGTLELPVKGTKFIIAYTRSTERLTVLAVYHSARRWPEVWLEAAITTGIESGEATTLDMKEVVERLPKPPSNNGSASEEERLL
jgi:toxin ParE1/3/4